MIEHFRQQGGLWEQFPTFRFGVAENIPTRNAMLLLQNVVMQKCLIQKCHCGNLISIQILQRGNGHYFKPLLLLCVGSMF